MENIKHLFYPESIAILGASTSLSKFSGRPLKYLLKHGYQGKIFPVNSRDEVQEIMNLPCYRRLSDIKEPVDQVIIALPSKLVPDALRECASIGAKSVVLFSSGFAETGIEGEEEQDEIATIARRANIALCGPNCQGLINLHGKVTSSFSNVLDLDHLVTGNIGFISQSGALAGSILSLAQQKKIGLSHWVSVGNEAVLGVADYLQYLATDDTTSVIAIYLEGMSDISGWMEACELARRSNKPIVVMKTGSSETGGKAVQSHTGAIAGEDFIVDAFYRKNGVVRVLSIDALLNTSVLLSTGKKPGKGRVGILTSSGGAGIILADTCSEFSIQVPDLTQATKARLKSLLPDYASVSNPVDVTAQFFQTVFTEDPDFFKTCLQSMLEDPNVDMLIICLTMLVGERAQKCAQDIAEISANSSKVIAVVWFAGEMGMDGYQVLQENRIPLYHSADDCVSSISNLMTYQLRLDEKARNREEDVVLTASSADREAGMEIPDLILDPATPINESEAKKIISSYGIPVPKGDLATTEQEAIRIAKQLGYPLALKISSPDIIHKSDAGCVMLNIESEDGLVDAFHQILLNAKGHKPAAAIDGVFIEEMIESKGTFEAVLGILNSPPFDPVIFIGIGGVFVEVFREVESRMAPLSRHDVSEMIKRMRVYPILEGARGKDRLDISALEDALMAFSNLSMDLQKVVSEIEINPLMVLQEGKGVIAIDALVTRI